MKLTTTLIILSFLFSTQIWAKSSIHYNVDISKGAVIGVGTWNIVDGKTFLFRKDNTKRIYKQLDEEALGQSDILCLQESYNLEEHHKLKALASRYGYHFFDGGADDILSKWPIIEGGQALVNPKTGRRATWANIEHPELGVIRVYSIHLSYKVHRWPIIPIIRGQEAARLIKHAEKFKGPVIFAGDFNTFHFDSHNVERTQVMRFIKGAGFTNSFRDLNCFTHPPGRVDWIFHNAGQTLFSTCGKWAGSDHRWMFSQIFLPYSM